MARYNILDALLPLSFIGVIGTFIGSSFWFYDIGEVQYYSLVFRMNSVRHASEQHAFDLGKAAR